LVQSRGSRIVESLTEKEINDIADSPAGKIQNTIEQVVQDSTIEKPSIVTPPKPTEKPVKMHYAVISPSGKVNIQ
jgi:hypothetical protein